MQVVLSCYVLRKRKRHVLMGEVFTLVQSPGAFGPGADSLE